MGLSSKSEPRGHLHHEVKRSGGGREGVVFSNGDMAKAQTRVEKRNTETSNASLLNSRRRPLIPRLVARRIPREQQEQIRYLRVNMTRAETDLWYRLNRNQLGVHFRRQHPIGPYIVDFAAVRNRLVVEVDGPTHVYPTREVLRETEIRDRGWQVLRFWNEDVFDDVDAVVEKIKLQLDT